MENSFHPYITVTNYLILCILVMLIWYVGFENEFQLRICIIYFFFKKIKAEVKAWK